MLQLAEGLISRGIDIDFVVGHAEGELLGEVPAQARIVPLTRAPVSWTRARVRVLLAQPDAWRLMLRPRHKLKVVKPLLRWLPGMIDYIGRARPDAMLAAEPRYNLLAIWAQRLSRTGSRILVSERTIVSQQAKAGGPWGDPVLHPLFRGAYLNADAITTVSDGAADDLAAYADLPRDRITTIYNPVVGPDLDRRAREPLDHTWFASLEPPVILGAGRLHPVKDFATLIRAFAHVRAKRPARLIILGAESPTAPEYAAELSTLSATLGIADDVLLPGFVPNPLPFMAGASVFALSSLYEGLPGVVIQALACGCPVVSTDCPGGLREILDQGRVGSLVPVGDDVAFARAIEDMLDNPPRAESLRARAEFFSLERGVDNYLRLLFPAGVKMPYRAAA